MMNKYIKMFLNLFKKKELVSKKGDKFIYKDNKEVIRTVDYFVGFEGYKSNYYQDAYNSYKNIDFSKKPYGRKRINNIIIIGVIPVENPYGMCDRNFCYKID